MTGEELTNLKTLAENRAGFARSALFDRVAALLFESEGELSPEVRTLIDQILTGLIRHVETDVRHKVAGRIATLHSAPHELCKVLANDAIEIARPILEHSPVLTEDDLIMVVEEKTIDHRVAVAKRPEVPAGVSAALASFKEQRVLEFLLANSGAVIPREVFGDLVALSRSVETLRKPLTSRSDLPKDLAHQMFWWVSAALRHAILERFTVDAKELDDMLASVLVDRQRDQRAVRKLVAGGQWRQTGVHALVTKLKSGDVNGFTHDFASVIGVDVKTAAKIVLDSGGEALAIACKAMGADRSQFTTIFMQLDFKRTGKARPASHIQNVSKIYDLLPKDRAQAAVSLWNAQSPLAA